MKLSQIVKATMLVTVMSIVTWMVIYGAVAA